MIPFPWNFLDLHLQYARKYDSIMASNYVKQRCVSDSNYARQRCKRQPPVAPSNSKAPSYRTGSVVCRMYTCNWLNLVSSYNHVCLVAGSFWSATLRPFPWNFLDLHLQHARKYESIMVSNYVKRRCVSDSNYARQRCKRQARAAPSSNSKAPSFRTGSVVCIHVHVAD